MEADTLAQLDLKRLIVEPIDLLSQLQMHVIARVARHQPVKHIADYTLRRPVAVIGRI